MLRRLRRSFSEIAAATAEVRQHRQKQEQRAVERSLLAQFDALATREEQVWAALLGMLATRRASGYDEAVTHLAALRDLVAQRNQRPAFDAQLAAVIAHYGGSAARLRRLREHKLMV